MRQHDPLFTWKNATVTTNIEVALHKFTVWSVSHDTYAYYSEHNFQMVMHKRSP